MCSTSITFHPVAAGAASGAFTARDNAASSPQSATLSGTGLAPAQLAVTPSSHDYGSVVVGDTATGEQYTVTNSGDVPTGTLSSSLSGAGFGFVSDGCNGSALAAHSSCLITVSFAPGGPGPASGMLVISGTPGGSTGATLSGTGQAPNPWIHSLTILTPTVDTTNGPATVSVDVVITDDLSGFANGSIDFRSVEVPGQDVVASSSAIPIAPDTYRFQAVLPQYAASGVWQIMSIRVFDNAGNASGYADPSLGLSAPPLPASFDHQFTNTGA
jgi:hypothetical protein